GEGCAGVAGLISRTSGAIGYVDIAYAIKNHIKFAAVRNKAGKFLFPSLRRIEAAATAFTTVPANIELHIVNPPKSAALAYPISTYTYVIVHKKSAHAAELRKMIFWALTQGQGSQFAAKLTFAKLSTNKKVIVAAEKTLKQIRATGTEPGNVARIRRPRRGPPSASMSPPAATTMCFTIARPRPVPRGVRAASAR